MSFSSLLAIALTKRTIERRHEMRHAECQTVIWKGVSNHARDIRTGASAVALVRRRSQTVSVRARVQRLHAAVAIMPSGSSRRTGNVKDTVVPWPGTLDNSI